MKKNCLNCAFCARNQDKFITFPFPSERKPFWRYDCKTLSANEREKLKNGDASFLGAKKREYEKWIKNYEQKKEEYDKRKDKKLLEVKNNLSKFGLEKITPLVDVVSNLQNVQNTMPFCGKSYDDYEQYGISEPMPDGNFPDKDYLSCWKECWNEENNNELVACRDRLKHHKCAHFYPFNKMQNKSLELCGQELREEKLNKQFWLSIIISVLALLISLFKN